jgi:hypothetical protein
MRSPFGDQDGKLSCAEPAVSVRIAPVATSAIDGAASTPANHPQDRVICIASTPRRALMHYYARPNGGGCS